MRCDGKNVKDDLKYMSINQADEGKTHQDKHGEPWLVRFSGLSASLQPTGSLVRFLVRAHAWVVGWVPNWGHARGNDTSMFLSLSFSLLSPLSKNK